MFLEKVVLGICYETPSFSTNVNRHFKAAEAIRSKKLGVRVVWEELK